MALGTLRGEGSILYGDAQGLLEALEGILANGGLMVEAASPPPLRTPAEYALSFGSVRTAALRAEAVFASGSNVGFQVLDLEQIRPQLVQLRDQLASMAAPAQPPPPAARVPHAPTAAQLANRNRPTTEVFGVEWNLEAQEEATEPGTELNLDEEPIPAAPRAGRPAPTPAPEASPTASEPAPTEEPSFSHSGPLVPPLTVDEVIGSPAQREGVAKGDALPAVQVLIAAAELVVPCTVQLGGWTLQIARQHVVGVGLPDSDTSLNHLPRRIVQSKISALAKEAAREQVTIEYLALERKLATRQELAKGFHELLMNRTQEIVQVTEGSYQINSGFALQMGVAIPFERLGQEAVRRSLHTLPTGAAGRWFAERMNSALVPGGAPIKTVARISGEQRYHRWIGRLTGRAPLRELFQGAPMVREVACELILGLLATRRCELVKASADETVDPVEQATELLGLIQDQLPFAALGLHWSVHAGEVEARIKARRAELGPRGSLARHSSMAAGMCKQALRLSEAAYAELSIPGTRALARKQAAGDSGLATAKKTLTKRAEQARSRGQSTEHKRLLEVMAELR